MGRWLKAVRRVLALLHIEDSTSAPPLQAGMTALVSIDTGSEGGLEVSVQRALAENHYQ